VDGTGDPIWGGASGRFLRLRATRGALRSVGAGGGSASRSAGLSSSAWARSTIERTVALFAAAWTVWIRPSERFECSASSRCDHCRRMRAARTRTPRACSKLSGLRVFGLFPDQLVVVSRAPVGTSKDATSTCSPADSRKRVVGITFVAPASMAWRCLGSREQRSAAASSVRQSARRRSRTAFARSEAVTVRTFGGAVSGRLGAAT